MKKIDELNSILKRCTRQFENSKKMHLDYHIYLINKSNTGIQKTPLNCLLYSCPYGPSTVNI